MNRLIYSDTPVAWQLGFQNPATPVMEGIISLHNYVMMYLILVFVVVAWFLLRSLYLFRVEKNSEPLEFNHDPVIETVWTIAPAFILIAIAIPSFSLLYSMDDVTEPMLTVKAIGHQWYWSYELDAHRREALYTYLPFKMPRSKPFDKQPTVIALSKYLKMHYIKSKGITLAKASKFKSSYFKSFLKHNLLDVHRRPKVFDLPSQILKAKIIANYKLAKMLKFKKKLKCIKHLNKFIDVRDAYNFHMTKRMAISYFWSYEFITYHYMLKETIAWIGPSIKFDSYMLQEADLPEGGLRLLEVDNRLVLPTQSHIRLLVTSMDVIHSWAVPSLGVKVDAIPGRLNQADIFIKRVGVFYGQCSELCGVNHGFMPIVVVGAGPEEFANWVKSHSTPKTLDELLASDWDFKAE